MNPLRKLSFYLCCLPGLLFTGSNAPGDTAEVDAAREWGTYLTQHHYAAIKVIDGHTNAQEVETMINGKRIYLTIDTGCDRTLVTASCARHLKLEVREARKEEWGAGGKVKGPSGVARIQSFTMGSYEINRTNLIDVLSPQAFFDGGTDGLLGLDYLRLNAAIFPVGSRVLLLKPGATPVVSIDHYMDLLGYKGVPLIYTKGGLRIAGLLNGQPLNAIIDCGAEFSSFDADFVKKALGHALVSSNLNMRGLDGNKTPGYNFVPNDLQFGSFTFKPLELVAITSPSFALEGFNALFGYELLASHHAIIDMGHDTLWMK